MTDEVKKLLKLVSLFRGLDDRQVEQVAEITQPETYGADETIFDQGNTGDKMYVIQDGQVEIQVKDNAGLLNSVLILGQGQVFGEMALLDSGERSASVIALQPNTVVYGISGNEFTALCEADAAIGYIMMRNIALDLSFKIRHQNSFS